MNQPETGSAVEWNYTHDQVMKVLNQVADDILEAVDAGETGLCDALSLMVSAVCHYLTNPMENNLTAVITSGYEAEVDEVLGWIRECV